MPNRYPTMTKAPNAYGVPIATIALTFFGAILALIAFTSPEWYTATVRITTVVGNGTASFNQTQVINYRFGLWRLCPNGLDVAPSDLSTEDTCSRLTERSGRMLPGVCEGPSKIAYPRAAQGFLLMSLATTLFGLLSMVLSVTFAGGNKALKGLSIVLLLIATLFAFISAAVYYGLMNYRYCSDKLENVCRPSQNVTCDEYANYGVGFAFGAAAVLLLSFILAIFVDVQAPSLLRAASSEPAAADAAPEATA